MSFNLATILRETAAATPDALAYHAAGSSATYRELDEQSGRFAAGLARAGLTPGQVVAIQLPNVPQFLTAYFGALKAGMVLLPINPLLKAPEIEHQLTDSGASIMLGLAGLHAEAAKACELADLPLYLVGDPPTGVAARSLGELMAAQPACSLGERMDAGSRLSRAGRSGQGTPMTPLY
jgi:long-chain acyl-CoA synthetase